MRYTNPSDPHPLSNRGGLAQPQKTVLNTQPPLRAGIADSFQVELDRLRLVWGICSVRVADPAGPMGCAWSKSRRGPNRGAGQTTIRRAWSKPKGEEGGIFYEERTHEGMQSRELIAEFNPAKLRASDWHAIAQTASYYGATADPWVDRFDVAFTRDSDPYEIRLYSPRRAMDGMRETPRGFETETVGYVKGTPLILQKYDKGRERAAAGHSISGSRVRVEMRVQRPWMRAEYPDGLRLSDLHRCSFPMIEGEKVLQFIRPDDGYVDSRYIAISAVARVLGMRQARAVAQDLLGRDGWDQAQFCVFDDLTPAMERLYRSEWPSAVALAQRELVAA